MSSNTTEAVEASPLPLVETLYGGEWGEEARRDGDEIRILLWLRSMALETEQVQALAQAARTAQDALSRLAANKSQAAASERESLSALYHEMSSVLRERTLSNEESAAFAERLRKGREGLPDPRAMSQRFAEERIAQAEVFLGLLTPVQQREMANALFFLRQETGSGSASESFEALLGQPWRSSDFSTLRRSASPPAIDEEEIAALWTLEAGSTQALDTLSHANLLAITALALVHPQLEATSLSLLAQEPEALSP